MSSSSTEHPPTTTSAIGLHRLRDAYSVTVPKFHFCAVCVSCGDRFRSLEARAPKGAKPARLCALVVLDFLCCGTYTVPGRCAVLAVTSHSASFPDRKTMTVFKGLCVAQSITKRVQAINCRLAGKEQQKVCTSALQPTLQFIEFIVWQVLRWRRGYGSVEWYAAIDWSRGHGLLEMACGAPEKWPPFDFLFFTFAGMPVSTRVRSLSDTDSANFRMPGHTKL